MTTITLTKKQLASLDHLLYFLKEDSEDEIIQSDLKIVSEVFTSEIMRPELFKPTVKKSNNMPKPKYKIMTIEKYNMLMKCWNERVPKCIGVNGVPCIFDADADLCEEYFEGSADYNKYWKQCKHCADEQYNDEEECCDCENFGDENCKCGCH